MAPPGHASLDPDDFRAPPATRLRSLSRFAHNCVSSARFPRLPDCSGNQLLDFADLSRVVKGIVLNHARICQENRVQSQRSNLRHAVGLSGFRMMKKSEGCLVDCVKPLAYNRLYSFLMRNVPLSWNECLKGLRGAVFRLRPRQFDGAGPDNRLTPGGQAAVARSACEDNDIERNADRIGIIILSSWLRLCAGQAESDRELRARTGNPGTLIRKTMNASDLPASLRPFTGHERLIVEAVGEADTWVLGQSGVVSSDKEALEKARTIRLLDDRGVEIAYLHYAPDVIYARDIGLHLLSEGGLNLKRSE